LNDDMRFGYALAMEGVKEKIHSILSELRIKGYGEPIGFSVLSGFVEDCIIENRNGLSGDANVVMEQLRRPNSPEPRVMSKEEVDEWNHTKRSVREPVYVEHRYSGEVFAYSVGFYGTCDYGITWRCWTARPTDVQKKEAPWG